MNPLEWIVPLVNLVTLIFISGGALFVIRQKTIDLGIALETIKKDLGIDISEVKESMGDRMGRIEDNLEKLTVVTVNQARHDERLNALDQRLLGQGQRMDDFIRQQGEALERMARMVENVISRVNALADQGVRPARG